MSNNVRNDSGPPRTPRGRECEEIYKSLQLYSTNDEVLRKIKLGDKLTFKVIIKAGSPSLEVFYEEERAGAVIEYQLTDCIQRQHEYLGEVVSIESGLCIIDAILKGK
ncbi:MAG: hypothetical protein LUM44_21155 [Pyrinomonadaceae bacterium]|nr:hypothetical protein [Pyrinomonadaceae bacterium]